MVDSNKDDKLDTEIAQRLDDLFGEGNASSDQSEPLIADDPVVDENNTPEPAPESAPEPEPEPEDEEIFDLDDAVENKADTEHTPAAYPLAELKNMVLSIDWEITDEVLSGFLAQVNDLKNIYKNEKIILMFLQLLGSLGEYIKTNRGKAHPKTFKTLNSVFSCLEDVVLTENMAESEKKKLLKAEMKKYKQLRKQVAQKKATAGSRGKAKPLQKDKPNLRAPEKKKSLALSDKVSRAKEHRPSSDPIAANSYDTLSEAIEELKQYIHAEFSVLRQEIKMLKKSR